MKFQLLAFLPLLVIGACSSSDQPPTPKTTSTDATGTQQPVGKKISDDNPFKSQLEALDAAKKMGITAQDSIDKNHQALEATRQ